MKPQTQISESESRELVLDSYVMYIHNNPCDGCGRVERFSQCFEVWLHPTKTRTSGFRDLRPATRINPDLAMATVSGSHKTIPVCVSCAVPHHAKDAPPHLSSAAWAETLKRKYMAAPKPEPKVAKASATPKVVAPTLDQI